MSSPKPTLVVYGATSYTASNHLLPYLATHHDIDKIHLILAGRNADKLAALDASLPSTGPRREVVVLRLDDAAGVDSLVGRANVIVNFAGPYQLHNADALIHACARLGKHYVDLSGEVNQMAEAVHKYDFLASKTGAIIVPACGFDSVPADLSVYSALSALQGHVGSHVGLRASTNFYDLAGGVSGGTLASVGAVSESGAGFNPMFEYALCPSSELVSAKPNLSMVKRAPVRIAGAPTIGAFFVGEMIDLAIIRRSWFLSRLDTSLLPEAHGRKSNEPVHSANTAFAEAFSAMGPMRASNIFLAYIWSAVILFAVGLYASSRIVRDALSKWVPQPGEGPSMEACVKGHTRVTNVSVSDDGKYAVVTRYAGAGDPGYSHTGKLIGEGALALILPPPNGFTLPPLAQTGGLLTPSTGIGKVFIERLRVHGVATIESEIIELSGGQEGKKDL